MHIFQTKKFAYSFIIIFILSNFIWNLLLRNQQALLDWGGVTFQMIACLISVGWLISAFAKYHGSLRSFWVLLSLGILCYLIGTLIWSFEHFILHLSANRNKLPEVFWLAQNGFYFVALLVSMNNIKNNLFTIRSFLDMLIAMVVAITFSWIFLIGPLLEHRTTIIFHITEILYPILDLGVFVGVLSFFSASHHRIFSKKTTILLTAGLLIQIIADTIYSYLKIVNQYSVGSVNEPLWILSILFIGLSSIGYAPSQSRESHIDPVRQHSSMLIKHSIPYLGVIFLSIYAISFFEKKSPAFLGLFISILLVIVRQLFTLFENKKLVDNLNQLNEELEVKVKERTDRLVETINNMEYLAYHDTVTNLPNRRFLEKRLSQAIPHLSDESKQMAFMLFDLDRFKHINDSLGHSYGDLLLKEVSKRIVQCLKPTEEVFRIGGDEFALLIENTNKQEIEKTALRLLSTIRKTFYLKDFELHITPSIGVAIFPDHGSDLDSLLMKADTAMYKVKANGKNNYKVYTSSMSMEHMMEFEHSLRKALEWDEFLLYYQPQVSIATNKIVGVEALLRWRRPGYGFIPPADFIPLAEETGLILAIGEKVLRKACEQSVAWRQKGLTDLRIAVNISTLQFQQTNFIEMVTNIISETGANPNQIELEITESVAMGPIENFLAKLSLLKHMGFQIAIDDFGTGYSSLHYLSQFQINRLKIDRSFISSLEKSEKDEAIVKLIVMMAKGLNFNVLAEGVETEAQSTFLKQIGCDEFQGYLFSRPLSLDECEHLLF